MAKIRGIKPEYWTDEDIVELSLPARLLFIGLWNLACDNGHVPDKPKQIKMRLLPADELDVDALLDELVARGRLERANGTVTINNFAKHQKPHRRWWTTCDLPLCALPEGAPEQGHNRGGGTSHTPSQPESNRGATGGHGGTTADVDCEVDVEVDSDGEGDARPVASRASRKTRLAATWTPNPKHETFANENRLNLKLEADQFRDHALANDRRQVDWDAAFRSWLRNAIKFRHRQPEPVRVLPHAHELEHPPDGLSEAEYSSWLHSRRQGVAR